MEEVTTEHVDFAACGVVHVEKSFGELNIAAWDQPSVQIVATRFTYRDNTPREKEKTSDRLKRIQVTRTIGNNGDLTISTAGKHARGIDMDYQIMVPRTARLVIHHGTGDVVVLDVSGDIHASAHMGDILVQLPQAEHEVIDAKCSIGAIYSDFQGARNQHLVGSHLIEDAPTADAKGPSQHVDLRVGTGGITILKRNAVAEGAAGL